MSDNESSRADMAPDVGDNVYVWPGRFVRSLAPRRALEPTADLSRWEWDHFSNHPGDVYHGRDCPVCSGREPWPDQEPFGERS